MKTIHKLLLSALVIACSGCATMCEDCDDMACRCRDRCRGYIAWWHWRPVYSGLGCESDFGAGFRDGYAAMATDGSATAPALPPRSYWSPRYQSATGHEQMQAWFDGYAHGALAAEQDGVNQWSRIRTNPTVTNRGYPGNNQNVIYDKSAKPAAPPVPATPDAEDGPAIEDLSQPSVPVFPPPSDESTDQF